ncbi:hypothetical protein ACFWHR_07580 [Leucobacter sp. NPDC058333]|uniref:hypothetical protein n=1 Tax=Leucobacter sp. NPDC058333 TaxID=3346450 RepID=UPI0036465C14
MTGITEAEIERLSLIRYQLRSAGEMLKQPPPINTLSINSMQDAIESSLGAVAEHIGADVKARSDFDKLFDAVATRLGSPAELVGLRTAAIALNNARVGFKHHGNQVRDETLRRHNDVAVTLVHQLVTSGFRIALDDVSLLVFVRHEGVRTYIEKAESLAHENRIIDALSYLRSAFQLAVDDYAARKSIDGWRTIFDVSPSSPTRVGIDEWGWEKPLKQVRDWVASLDQKVMLSAMGIDLSRYAYFDAVAPTHIRLMGYGTGPHVQVRFKNPTDDHYRASYMFVVDSAVRLAASDFNLALTRNAIHPVETYDPEFVSESYLQKQEEYARRRAHWTAQKHGNEDTQVE